jgi:hypothetical protein
MWRKFLAVAGLGHEQRPESSPMGVFAACQVFVTLGDRFFELRDPTNQICPCGFIVLLPSPRAHETILSRSDFELQS